MTVWPDLVVFIAAYFAVAGILLAACWVLILAVRGVLWLLEALWDRLMS